MYMKQMNQITTVVSALMTIGWLQNYNVTVTYITSCDTDDACIADCDTQPEMQEDQQRFNDYVQAHAAHVDLLQFVHDAKLHRRSYQQLRKLLCKHYNVEIPPLTTMRDELQSITAPLLPDMRKHRYEIKNKTLASTLPAKFVTWESSRYTSCINT